MPDAPPIRVLLVDDHQMVRQGLIYFLSTQKGIEVVGEGERSEDAVALVEKHNPDVVLMDLVFPDSEKDGIDAVEAINKHYPHIDVIVLTSFIDDDKVKKAIQAGAAGYIMKDIDPSELANAIHATRRGELFLHPEAARRLAEALRPGPGEQEEPTPDTLTNRETEVLVLITSGMSNHEIAQQLDISLKTVKAHVSNVLQKLNLDSRVQAALYALRHQIVELNDI